MSKRKEEFRIDLTGDHVDYFHSIKQKNNLSKNVDVFRYCLETTMEVEEYGQLPYGTINPKQNHLITSYLDRQDIQEQFQVFSLEDVIKKGVESILAQMINFSKDKSILHWDVRNSLSGDHKEVALAFRDCQVADDNNEVTAKDVAVELGWRDVDKVEKILDSFVSQNLLEVEEIKKTKYYHASKSS